MGDALVDLPVAVHLAVEVGFGLDAGLVVGVHQADLGGAAHAARHHVFADDVGDVQQVDGAQLGTGRPLPGAGGGDHLVDLGQHGHHGARAAGGAAKGLEPLSLGADGVVVHHQGVDALVLPVGQQLKIPADGLGPAFFGIADGQGGGVPLEGQVGVFQPLGRRHRVIGFVQDLQVGAHRRQLLGVGFQHPHPHAAAHHQQVEQVVVGGKVIDDGEGAVVVGHGVFFRHRGAPHPQGAARQKLPQVVDVVVELLGFFPGSGGQGGVVLHRPAHRLPPEFPPALLGQVPGIGAGVDKGAQLLHGVGGVLVGAEELPGQDALLPLAACALLLLLHAVEDIGLGGAVELLLEQRLLHRVLDALDVHDLLAGGRQFGLHRLGDPIHPFRVVFPCRGGGQGDGTAYKFSVKGHDLAAALAYVHCDLLPRNICATHYI